MLTAYYILMNLKEKIIKSFNRKQVMTVGEICSSVDRAEITVKKALKEHDYFTSYNFNSRFYTLSKFVHWDSNDIWKHPLALFTRHGPLHN